MARRRYQKGTLEQRGKNWVARWREDELREGKLHRVQKRETLGTLKDYPTKRLAFRELEARLSTINSPEYRARPTATFGEFATRWEATVLSQHKPSTASAIRSQLRKHFLPTWNTTALKDIQPQIVQFWLSGLKCAPKTARNLLATFRMIWNSAKAWGYVVHDPFNGLVLPAARRRQAFFFTLDEVQRIVAAANEPYRTFFWLAAETGMRAGELCGLRVEDIDLDNSTVQVRQSVWRGGIQTPKTHNAVRRLAISAALTGRLDRYIREQWRGNNSGLLFTTRNGTPWDANLLVKRKLHPLLASLGIRRAGLHAFRHASATVMDQNNVPMATRQSRLGHSDPRLTLGVYTHSVSDDDRKFAAEIGIKLGEFCDQVVPTKTEEVEPASPTPSESTT